MPIKIKIMEKTMKINLKAIMCCGLLSLFLTGCNIPGITKNNDDDDYFLTGTYNNQGDNNSEVTEIKWLKKPSIQASNIITSDLSQINTEDKINRSFLDISIIYNNGKYGFIDFEGNLILSPSYDYYYICSCGEMILYNKNNDQISETCSIDNDGQITYNTYFHEDNSPEYFWDDSTKKLYVRHKNETFAKEYTESEPIIAQNSSVTKIDYNSYSIAATANPYYALIKNNKIILDFNYEDFYAPPFRNPNSTAIALKKDGKWGYVSSDGDEIIPFECSDILSSFNGSISGDYEKNHPYLFSDGFVPVCINSEFYYYDLEGNRVTNGDSYEQARPVINGKAWVKCNGKWGVIQLGEIKEIKRTTTTTTTINTESKKSTSSSTTTTTLKSKITSKITEHKSNKKSTTTSKKTVPQTNITTKQTVATSITELTTEIHFSSTSQENTTT